MLQFHDFFSGGGTLRDRLDDLNSKLGQVNTLVTESDTQIENAKMKSEKATQKVVNAKEIIDQARESLRVIFFFFSVCRVIEFLIYPDCGLQRRCAFDRTCECACGYFSGCYVRLHISFSSLF